MAKAKKTQKRLPNEALDFSALRWYALMIDAKSMQCYVTDTGLYNQITAILLECVNKIDALHPPKPLSDDDDCPPGWVLCGQDCAPACISGAKTSRR